ncbi:UNVERIFIED_CONTAM: protein ALTERED PHOSPHATE STARVATION RESPONSE 1 [Sesamum radiatum]|uniref:Protein ALTERED PHOSPHATE STARVATION RESPONSE 1 n=1 Tax=Sesamum radiatum TaxID=300843 RepID=A0AAW2SH35_SESRA
MGCSGSKAEDLPLVIRCRQRRELILAAARHRYDLAAAHVSYFRSLKHVGDALRKFVDEELITTSVSSCSSVYSPSLIFPPASTMKSMNAGEPLNLHDDEDEEHESHLHLSDSSSDDDGDPEGDYEYQHHAHDSDDTRHDQHHSHRPEKGFDIRVKEEESPSPTYGTGDGSINGRYVYPFYLLSPRSYEEPYMDPGNLQGMWQPWYYSNSSNVNYMRKSAQAIKTVVQEPPAQPAYGYLDSYWNSPAGYGHRYCPISPETVNLGTVMVSKRVHEKRRHLLRRQKRQRGTFSTLLMCLIVGIQVINSTGRYGYGSNFSSPGSSDVRELEGIPDLEEKVGMRRTKRSSKERERVLERALVVLEQCQCIKAVGVVQHQCHCPSVNAVQDQCNYVKVKAVPEQCLHRVVRKVGNRQYCRHHRRVMGNRWMINPQKILYLISPSLTLRESRSTQYVKLASRTMKLAKSYFGDVGEDASTRVYNLSSTLEKLGAWEKKLYKEDEERLRVVYEKQCKRLNILDEEGAEPRKIDATQASIRRLRTKLDVRVKAINIISSRIHKLRDDELQPKVAALIYGLIRMWKAMLKCHRKQFQAIMECKIRRLKVSTGFPADSSSRAASELEKELRACCHHLKDWIVFQRSYVESLNGWLLHCLQSEPEETPDGPVPYSPGQLGAPPIFIVCNDWHQAMEAISEGRVVNALNAFAVPSDRGVSQLDDQKLSLESLKLRLAEERIEHKDAIKLVGDAAASSLQGRLVPLFKALENFTSEAVKAHEHIRLQHSLQSL